MSENTNNEVKAEETSVFTAEPAKPVEAEKVEEPAKIEEVVKTEDVVVEEPKIQEAPKPAPTVIEAPKPSEKQGLGPVGHGAMGVATFSENKKPAAKKAVVEKKEETAAIHSTRNVTWNGVGKVYIGYNIVSKSAADKWLTRDHTRLATPEEVAEEFNK
jgi:outer membrane biosynthesis protein TonB